MDDMPSPKSGTKPTALRGTRAKEPRLGRPPKYGEPRKKRTFVMRESIHALLVKGALKNGLPQNELLEKLIMEWAVSSSLAKRTEPRTARAESLPG
jgi:hypothetical protein